MKITLNQTQRLLTGNQTFSQLGFSMMLTRLKGQYAGDPSKLEKYAAEINAFLARFASIMADDYAIIAKM